MTFKSVVQSGIETLFPVGKGCVICLQDDHQSDHCPEEQSEPCTLNRPIPGHPCCSYHELVSMALSEEDGTERQLPRTKIRDWVGLHRCDIDLGKNVDEALAKGFDQTNEKDDIWTLRPRLEYSESKREVPPLQKSEFNKPSRSNASKSDAPGLMTDKDLSQTPIPEPETHS